MAERPPRLDESSVEALVASAHGDLDAVQALLEAEPALVNGAWDWGGGDWETALGAAAHTGQREIAEFLLSRGARIDIFAAAMLGHVEVVGALLDAFPQLLDAKGPHGIPLSDHAAMGGAGAAGVVALLEERNVARDVAGRPGQLP